MSLHTPTLSIAIAIVQFALSATLLFFLSTRKAYPGIARLVSCQVLWCAGYLLLLGRGVVPDWASVLLANYLFILGIGQIYEGLSEFSGNRIALPTRAVIHLGGVVTIAMMTWHSYIEPDFNARVAEFNTYRLVLSSMCMGLVLRHRDSPRFRVVLPLLLAVFGISVVSTALRAGVALYTTSIDSLDNDVMFRLHMLSDLVLFVVIAFIVLLLSTVRSEQELEEARRQADQAARADPLTGLWNRLHFESAGRIEEARARRYGVPLSVMMFDIDHFKTVNDRSGHLIGDRVIRAVASMTTSTLRSSDLIFRWGGEEFVVLLPVDAKAAAEAAEKLREAVAGMEIPGWGSVTVSIGVAQMEVGKDLAECLQRADKLLYRAKHEGRDRVEAQLEALA